MSEAPTPTGSPWAFVAVVGAAAVATAWAVKRAGGLAVALTTGGAAAGANEPSAVHTLLYGDEAPDEYAADELDAADEADEADEPRRGSAVDSW